MSASGIEGIFSNGRSTLGNLFLLSYVGYLGGLALEKPALMAAAFNGVLFFGFFWLLYNVIGLIKSLTPKGRPRY